MHTGSAGPREHNAVVDISLTGAVEGIEDAVRAGAALEAVVASDILVEVATG